MCLEDIGLTPSSSSGSSFHVSSPPKFIKRAFLKTFNEPVLTLNEKRSPTLNNYTEDRTKASNNVAKQLFQEPRTESHKHQTATLSTMVHGTGQQKEEMRRSTENKCLIGNTATADPCPTLSSKLDQKQEVGFSVSSHTSFLPGLTDKFEISCPLQQPKVTSSSSLDITDLHNSKTTTKSRKDEQEKRDLVWKDPLDLELGEDVFESCVLSLSSSQSSEEDHLPSFQEILECSTHVPITPEKVTFSEPSTPGLKVAVSSHQHTF